MSGDVTVGPCPGKGGRAMSLTEMGTLGSEHGQGQGRGMARALKCSSVCLVLEMSRIQPRGLRRHTVTKKEAERCPRSQVGGRLKASAVSCVTGCREIKSDEDTPLHVAS